MKFVDEAIVSVRSGNGGAGCVSFRREKYVPRGGPDGGDGGRGGDVWFVATTRRRTLVQFRFQRHFSAGNGAPGQGSRRTGAGGRDRTVELPPGTVISDPETRTVLVDLVTAGQRYLAAQGGRGGHGNTRFKSATNRAPRHAQPGEAGVERRFKLELKLLADVGIIGLPNAGKSTLVAALSAARPKIGNYPFTTLTPSLGVVTPGWSEPFVVADIPGLIAGAHQGAGLGIQFLRHVERTRVLIHLLDAARLDPADPLADYHTVCRELQAHNPELARKPQVVALNKIDLPEARRRLASFQAQVLPHPVIPVSAAAGDNLERLVRTTVELLASSPDLNADADPV